MAPVAAAFPSGVLATTLAMHGQIVLAIAMAVIGSITASLTAIAWSPAGEALADGWVNHSLLTAAAKEARRSRPSQIQNAVTLAQAIAPRDRRPPRE
jgi:hypothetical protein